MSRVLLMGGSGLIGSALANFLTGKGFTVSILSRNPERIKNYRSFFWNPQKMEYDRNAFLNQDYIINLAGESIASKFWTKKRKQLLLASRIDSINLLSDAINKQLCLPKKIINASAIGFYGSRPNQVLTEDTGKGIGFLSDVCDKWERELEQIKYPVVKLRIGIVLSSKGGFLNQMLKILKTRFNIIFGNGTQSVSWIHIDDLVRAIYFVLLQEKDYPVYNCTSPESSDLLTFNKDIADNLGFRTLLIKVPGIILKALVGDFSELFLSDQNVYPTKLLSQGFTFSHSSLRKSLENLL